MRKPTLHKLPVFRHRITKQRAVLSPVFGTDRYVVDFFDHRQRYGREVFMGHKSTCLEFTADMGFKV